jgi:flavin-dependent dehydrogenase
VGKWIGLNNRHLMPALQVTVPLNSAVDHTEVHFHPDITGGYGWLFPKRGRANVGVGLGRYPEKRRDLSVLLNRFLKKLAAADKVESKSMRKTAGWIPAEPVRQTVSGNFLLAGDAAGQTNAITGAGIYQAVVCGQMAGRWAARAVKGDDLSLLMGYDTEWQELFAFSLQRAYNRRCLLEKNWRRLDEIIRRCWVGFKEYYAKN